MIPSKVREIALRVGVERDGNAATANFISFCVDCLARMDEGRTAKHTLKSSEDKTKNRENRKGGGNHG